MATNALAPAPVNALMQRVKGIASQGYDYVSGRAKAIYTDPIGDVKATLRGTQRRLDEFGALQEKAFGNKSNPMRITDQEAMALLGEQTLSGPMGFAPAGIIGYHGTTKAFKQFDRTRGVVVDDGVDSFGVMNKLGPHFAEDPEAVNQFLDVVDSSTRGGLKNMNIRRADVNMQKPFDVGSEDFFPALIEAKSFRQFTNSFDDASPYMPHKEMIQEIINKNKKSKTSAEIAKNIREVLQTRGYNGVRYMGTQPDIAGYQAFVPFNIKSIEPSWGNAPTKF